MTLNLGLARCHPAPGGKPEFLPRLRAGIRPPMSLGEHVDRLEASYVRLLQ